MDNISENNDSVIIVVAIYIFKVCKKKTLGTVQVFLYSQGLNNRECIK